MPTRLPDNTTLEQVCASAPDAPPSVLNLGTTAIPSEPKANWAGYAVVQVDRKNLDEWNEDHSQRHRDAFPDDVVRPPARASHPFEPSDRADTCKRCGTPSRDHMPAWCFDDEWSADMEHVWAVRTRDDVKKLEARAARYRSEARALLAWQEGEGPVPSVSGIRRPAETRRKMLERGAALGRGDVTWGHGAITPDGRRVELLRAAEWCENRARATAMRRRDVVDACRGRWRRVQCGCGPRDVEVGCEQPMLCDWCRKRHWRTWRRRIVRAMGPHLRGARDLWNRGGRRGPVPGIYLVTLTMPHSGDIVVDRRVMGDAWRALSKRASYGGYTHAGRTYERVKWWGHHALVYEVTSGTKGDGHLHAHVAVISSWVPYDEMHKAWRAAIPGACVVDVVSPQEQAKRAIARGRKSNGPSDAAYYLAKYVTKGVEPAELSGRKAGEMLVAFRNRRKVTTSKYFWTPLRDRERFCKACGEMHELVGSPVSLQEHAPAAVMRSILARSAFTRRRETQTLLHMRSEHPRATIQR